MAAARDEAFDLVARDTTRVLVLGSLPGRQSLRERRYYAHPGNQFWRLMGGAIGVDLPALAYEERLAALLAAGIGLWDVIASAERPGSLDGAIRAPRLRDLRATIASLPALRAIAFNGGTALRHGLRQLGDSAAGLTILPLPSSSAAFTIGLAAKQPAWNGIRAFLATE